jgi:hypothetical protein
MKLRRAQIASRIIRCRSGQFGKPSDAKEEVVAIGGEAHTVLSYIVVLQRVKIHRTARCAKRDLPQSTALYFKSKALKQLT